MSFAFRSWLAVATCALAAACATSDPLKVGPDTYMVTSSGAGFSTAGVREKVFNAANAFAEERGMVAVPVSFKARPGELGSHPPSADLIFKLVKPGDPSIAQATLTEGDLVKVQETVKFEGAAQSQQTAPAAVIPDKYQKLAELKKLFDQGALTQKEYETEKAKVLASP